MSYLSLPRAYFSGKFQVSTATGNNSNTDWTGNWTYFDVAGVRLNITPPGSPQPWTPAQFRTWFMQMNQDSDPYVNAFWNYFGDNSVVFENMTVTGVELQPQNLITNPAQDAFIGGTVSFAGNQFGDVRTGSIMVDVDPVDAFTSQIFSNIFTVNNGSTSLLQGIGGNKACSYSLNYWRNLAEGGDNGCSAYWQIAIPNTELNLNTTNSPFLQVLAQGATQGQGIVIRVCNYLFEHITYEEIEKRLQAGNYAPTAGEMIMVGSIGVWGNGELSTIPPARVLNPNINLPLNSKQYLPVGVEPAKLTFFLGTTYANVDTTRKVVTLDLSGAVPEIDVYHTSDPNSGPATTPEKANLGNLRLLTSNPDPTQPGVTMLNQIGMIPFQGANINSPAYNKAAYLNRAGMIDIPYDPALESLILSGTLALQFGDGDMKAPLLLIENPYNIISDNRATYMELENKSTQYYSAQVLLRGKPAPAGVTFQISQTANETYSTDDPVFVAAPAAVKNPYSHTRLRKNAVRDEGSQIVTIPPNVTTQANGMLSIPITPYSQGIAKVWMQTPDDPDITKLKDPMDQLFIQGETWYYLNVRVLPDDSNLDGITDPSWQYMYDNFFMYYSLLYPTMNERVNFDDEAATTAAASIIKMFVSPRNANSTLYMPITRELSAGKRRLVQRWASQHE